MSDKIMIAELFVLAALVIGVALASGAILVFN